jgi:hypothetical protein
MFWRKERMSKQMMTMTLVAVVLCCMFSTPIFAHHSTAAYKDDEVQLKGTVTDYVWRNPHVLVFWNVKDDAGKVVEWTGECASVTSMLADGLTKSSLKPGDDVVITVRTSKAGTPNSLIRSIAKADGTVVLKWTRAGGGTLEERKAAGKIPQ